MNKKELIELIDNKSDVLTEVSRSLWINPETSGEEKSSSELLRMKLRENGFVIVEISDMPYAFYAEYGVGAPVIAVLGEYDALPGLSQRCTGTREPMGEGLPGHGCGHNLLGTASLGAAIALKTLLEENGGSGTVRFYGCPEEELLSGKPKMISKGAFEGCDAALSWHPMTSNTPYEEGFLANASIKFFFKGRTAHAAFSPHLGRSALDAVELMNVGANYLREHVIDKARIHYTTNSGGFTPNIVPDKADSWYYVRAPHVSDVKSILERLKKVAEGAAIMTETTVEHQIISGCCEMLPNAAMEVLTRNNMAQIGVPVFTDEENKFAQELLSSIPQEQLHMERRNYGYDLMNAPEIADKVTSKEAASRAPLTGSSDSGDVSYLMPMNLFTTACAPLGATAHTWLITACAGGSIGEKGMLYAAKILAAVGYDLFYDKDALSKAKAEFAVRSAQSSYSPII